MKDILKVFFGIVVIGMIIWVAVWWLVNEVLPGLWMKSF